MAWEKEDWTTWYDDTKRDINSLYLISKTWVLSYVPFIGGDSAALWNLVLVAIGVVVGRIEKACDLIVTPIETWADGVVTSIEAWVTEKYKWLDQYVLDVATRIGAVWGKIGPTIRYGAWTVSTWVNDRIDKAIEAIAGAWDDILEWSDEIATWFEDRADAAGEWLESKADQVWDWIDTKATEVWDWIDSKADEVWDWIDTKSAFYTDIFERFRNELLDFLEDPGGFIMNLIVDMIEDIVQKCFDVYW